MKRGEFFLIADFIEHWGEEPEEMNKNKKYKKCREFICGYTSLSIIVTADDRSIIREEYTPMEPLLVRLKGDMNGTNFMWTETAQQKL